MHLDALEAMTWWWEAGRSGDAVTKADCIVEFWDLFFGVCLLTVAVVEEEIKNDGLRNHSCYMRPFYRKVRSEQIGSGCRCFT